MKILICDDDRDFARGLKASVEENVSWVVGMHVYLVLAHEAHPSHLQYHILFDIFVKL